MKFPSTKTTLFFGLTVLLGSASACGLDPAPAAGKSLGSTGGQASTSQDKSSTSDVTGTNSADDATGSDTQTGSESPTSSSSESSSETSSSETTSESTDQSSSDTETTSSDTDSSTQEPGKIDCDTLKFSGFDPGQIPNAVSLTDSEDKKVQLRDFCNETVVVISGDSG